MKIKRGVKLSQCMIVKNEEKNIRRALEWAKGLAYEQIVVDTGSTDRTVEIAQEMGAKVYHFQWIGDFAAAKNYAIEQASGDWIAFLDADEYFTKEDTEKLGQLLERLQKHLDDPRAPLFIRCALVNLDGDGKPFMVAAQDRIFRNTPRIRYQGKIHEQIVLDGGKGKWRFLDEQKSLSIFHTGYSSQAYEDTGKSRRNLELLEKEVEEHPENYDNYAYLGDSYFVAGEEEKGEQAYLKALSGKVPEQIKKANQVRTANTLLRYYSRRPERTTTEAVIRIARCAGYPDEENPDLYYFLALCMYVRRDYDRAYQEMQEAFRRMESFKRGDPVYMLGVLDKALMQMANTCRKLGLMQETVRYSTLALKMNPRLDSTLARLLEILKDERGEAEHAGGTWDFLGKLYDLNSVSDLIFIYKCAKAVDFPALENRLLEAMPKEMREEVLRATAPSD